MRPGRSGERLQPFRGNPSSVRRSSSWRHPAYGLCPGVKEGSRIRVGEASLSVPGAHLKGRYAALSPGEKKLDTALANCPDLNNVQRAER